MDITPLVPQDRQIIEGYGAGRFRIAGAAVDWLYWLNYLTVFWPYEPEMFVDVAVNHPEQAFWLWMENRQGGRLGPLGSNLVLLSVGAISYLGSLVIFSRRDLPAPL